MLIVKSEYLRIFVLFVAFLAVIVVPRHNGSSHIN
jgi:hypothetical protein